MVLTPQGDFLEPYGKDHPVVWMGETSLTGGTYPVNDTALGKVATIICYDLNFTDTARKMAANGAQVLAVPSHDWPGLAPKQYTTLVLRAVENRVTLIKADGMYDSAIIDSAGRIVSSGASTTATRNTLLADVPLGRANALAIGWGDWVGWLCIAATAAFAIASPITAARSRKARERKLTSEGIGGNTGSSAVRKATPT
jgi:apolipoprotein N-acyltransferase